MKEEASRILLNFMKKPKLYSVNDQLHSPATLLPSGACNISQGAGGNVITTFLSSSLSAKCATLCGRRITTVGGLFSKDALAFQDLFIDVLLRVAWSNKHYVAMDEAQSGSRDALQAFLGARAELEGSGSEQEKMAAFEAMRTALTPIANGMCYCAGGHTRTAVVLHNELMGAGAARRPAPLLAVINSASSKLLLSEAEICWMSASDDDRDNFLAALTFGERVSRSQVCFPERRDPSMGMTLSNKVLYDEARLKGLVVGGGERFQPVVPSVALFLLMEHAQSSHFYPILCAELGLGAEEPDTFSLTRQVPWMRWEDFFMRYQAAQSVARSLRKELFKAVPLFTLLAPGGSIHMGDGPLLHTVLVDGSTARTQVLQRDLVAILSARGRGVGQERGKTIYQLPFGTMGADAVVFYRTVGPKGQWIVVIQQFKHSKADASTRLSPANIIADWEKLPKEDMMGRKLFKAWKGRIVYFNASNREHEGFPSELLSKDKDVSGLCSQHSVVVSRTNMAAALGPTFFNYINAMDWIHCGSLQPY
ncbi:hypothetical protein I4F81_007365 [Pyropia yezoensis]|uniref:Uncharacterized protein n=1 Tax=Pyropia yezoensis TaxID=2788 RepID=A0ACC3C4N4_PYRYE|nr:hypothetical protein I4F81_007365 [Neopyropia yezoensis]